MSTESMSADVKHADDMARVGEVRGHVAKSVAGGMADEGEMTARVNEVLNRHPAVGLAVGVVRDGRLAYFHGHGLADIASHTPITGTPSSASPRSPRPSRRSR